jgi:transmembrane sensor
MLRREAAKWLARLQSGRDPHVKRKFQRWHDADPRHSAAFDRVRRSYEQAGLLRYSPSVGSGPLEPVTRNSQWKPRPAFAAAAALAVLVPAVVLLRGGSPMFGGTEAVMLMTQVGEIRQIELADGSKVTLDSASKVDVEIGPSRRSAHLRYGRARFQIAKTDAPFVVETVASTITMRRGVIDVEQAGEQDRIEVLAGAAEVRASDGAQPSRGALGAGEAVTVNSAGAQQKSIVAPAPDWTRGMLQFDGTLLADAVALANRYSRQRIILDGDLGALRVTGAFRAGDTTHLAKALAAAFRLSLEQRADGNLVLSRKGFPAAQK